MSDLVTDEAKLREESVPIPHGSPVTELIDKMMNTLKTSQPTGLAISAVQVGEPVSIFILYDSHFKPVVIINPKVKSLKSGGWTTRHEGCLSLPGQIVPVCRPPMLKISGYNQYWMHRSYNFTGIMARAACHEMDHLLGRLIIDYLDTPNFIFVGSLVFGVPAPKKEQL